MRLYLDSNSRNMDSLAQIQHYLSSNNAVGAHNDMVAAVELNRQHGRVGAGHTLSSVRCAVSSAVPSVGARAAAIGCLVVVHWVLSVQERSK